MCYAGVCLDGHYHPELNVLKCIYNVRIQPVCGVQTWLKLIKQPHKTHIPHWNLCMTLCTLLMTLCTLLVRLGGQLKMVQVYWSCTHLWDLKDGLSSWLLADSVLNTVATWIVNYCMGVFSLPFSFPLMLSLQLCFFR